MQVFVRVPVPPVVLDHSIPVQAKAMSDHIEVKLMLMLPVDHPLVSSLSSLMGTNDGVSGDRQQEKLPPFSLDNDTRFLAMEGEVHFYCRNCTARLTKEPLRSFKELPSVNWRDSADNWFGTCCCTFGGVSQSLVSNFEKFSSVSKGTCFIGSTSILVHVDELASNAVIESGKTFIPDNGEAIGLIVKRNKLLQMNTSNHDFPTKCNTKDGILVQSKEHVSREKWECLSSHNAIRNVGNLHDVGGNGVAKLEKGEDYKNNHVHVSGSLLGLTKTENANAICDQELETMASAKKNEMDIPASDSSGLCPIETSLSESVAEASFQPLEKQFHRIPTLGNPIQNDRKDYLAADSDLRPSSHDTFSSYGIKNALHCCGNNNSENVYLQQLRVTSEPQKDGTTTGSFYLGNGFMMGPPDVSDTIEWVAVRCSSCLSLIGLYPDVKGKPCSASESIQLFKCHISTSEAVGGPNDVFRKHTLQRILVNQLQASAEDESSYRTVIRNLNTKNPMLQVVLLNVNAWFCSGNCWERIIPGEKATYYTEISIDRSEVFCDDVSKGLDGANSRPLVVTEAGATEQYNCKSLNPVVKVLFSDCSSFTPDESRAINDWALQKHAEEIYILEEEIKTLVEALIAMKLRLPASCSSLQGFYLSFLEK